MIGGKGAGMGWVCMEFEFELQVVREKTGMQVCDWLKPEMFR